MAKGILSSHKKKAVSLMVSYVLLVVIGIAISVFVYAYLKYYLPENRKECEVDTRVIISNVSCIASASDIRVDIENRGLFNISGVFVRFDTASGRAVKKQLNNGDEFLGIPIAPGESRALNFDDVSGIIDLDVSTPYEIEIEPAILDEGFLIPCKNSIATYPVTCY